MREILFKAKRTENGEWAEGYYYESKISGCYILMPKLNVRKKDGIIIGDSFDVYEVDPETVCQYTCLTDKNDKKIFEGDIVLYLDAYSTDSGYAEADCVGKVVWDNETLSFQVTERLSAESYEVLDECSVIGNIFDNPDLLEVE